MQRIVGIMGAMPEEINGVLELLTNKQEFTIGRRTYTQGQINNINVVVVFSRWGKVAASTTVSTLILKFGITELLFTGVAGAISEQLKIGDIVLATRLIQHDMDARPLMAQFEIPLLGTAFIDASKQQLHVAQQAINELIEKKHLHAVFSVATLLEFNIHKPTLFLGDIASGDTFFSSNAQKNQLTALLPSVLCVEMEGAAVAQVCVEYNIPFTIIRTISDAANDTSHIDFQLFISKISSKYSVEIIKNILH